MIGKRLKELRRNKAITQIGLAHALNVACGTIGNWEVDARDPDLSMLLKIAEYFNVSVDYLLGREDYFGNRYQNDGLKESMSSQESELISVFRSLLPEMQDFVLNMIKDLQTKQVKT